MLIEEIKTLQQHFRAAFDTVDHSILLNRLSSKLGLNGTALAWFRSYLSGRSQRVSVRGTVSDKFDLRYGVPQGSCLGPLLFTVYASALFDVVEKHLPTVHCYADDSQLYISFSPKAHSGQADAVASIEHCIQDIRQWMSQDKLLMNDAKTELLLIGTRQQLAKITIDGITVGHSVIAPQSPVWNLGVWLDSNLSMGDHITKTSSTALYYLFNIRMIWNILEKNVLKPWYMPLFLAALTIVTASYTAYRRISLKNCKESRTLLHVLCSKKVNFVILHHCWEPYTGYL